jgi:hypothetical protein
MSGFYAELRVYGGKPELLMPLKLVDLGSCEVVGSFCCQGARSAWTHIASTKQWRILETPGRLLLIEGSPDRYPHEGESLQEWLRGRKGSFRGFEILDRSRHSMPPVLTAFVDPWGSRPMFYLLTPDGRVAIADKLATLVINNPRSCEIEWRNMLESLVFSSLRSSGTTLTHTMSLSRGEAVRFSAGKICMRWASPMPPDTDITRDIVQRDPGKALLLGIQKAVQETWTNTTSSALLLSGGLDSRTILALAGPGRKALTLDVRPRETHRSTVDGIAGCSAPSTGTS